MSTIAKPAFRHASMLAALLLAALLGAPAQGALAAQDLAGAGQAEPDGSTPGATTMLLAAGDASGDAADVPQPGSEPADISGATVTVAGGSVFTGSPVEPGVTVFLDGAALSSGDYAVRYEDNVDAGTGRVVVTGKGSYGGTATKAFTIAKAPISGASASVAKQVFAGKALKPKPKVTFKGMTLKAGRDYTVAYKSNTNPGTAKVVLQGKGNFKGSKRATFKIAKAPASKMSVSKIAAKTYTGKAHAPSPKVSFAGKSLKEGRDYSLSYKANRNAGSAKVIVKGKGKFAGAKTVRFKIKPKAISKAAVATVPAQKYTGKAIKPTPAVTLAGKALKLGRDYELSYSSNAKAGTATITVEGVGNYKGTKEAHFTITKPAVRKASAPSAPSAGGGGGTVYITDTGGKFHRAGCRYLHSKHAISRSEAVADGYEACKVCKP